jgi:hypothetical protein
MSQLPELDSLRRRWRWLGWIEDVIYRIEMVFLLSLPLLGALAIYNIAPQYYKWTIVAGWLLALLHVYLHMPFYSVKSNLRGIRALLPLAPVVAAGVNQGFAATDFWHFFLESCVMEAGALMLGFAGILLVGKGMAGGSAWKDLGPFMVLMVAGLALATASPFFLAWSTKWELYTANPWMFASSLFGLGMATYHKNRFLQNMANDAGQRLRSSKLPTPKKVAPNTSNHRPESQSTSSTPQKDGFGFEEKLILFIVFGWIFLLPLVLWLFEVIQDAW